MSKRDPALLIEDMRAALEKIALELIWEIVRNSLPALRAQLDALA